VTIWETGAIIQYLIQHYDPKKLISYDTLKEKALLDQYLFFQASGQGPYWGQATW
jgi:glutathione S-transferase